MEIQKRKSNSMSSVRLAISLQLHSTSCQKKLKPLLKYITYLLLPLCLFRDISWIISWARWWAWQTMLIPTALIWRLASVISCSRCCWPLVSVVLFSIVCTLMKLYGERENRLQDLGWSEFLPRRSAWHETMLVVVGVSLAPYAHRAGCWSLAWVDSSCTLIVTSMHTSPFAVPGTSSSNLSDGRRHHNRGCSGKDFFPTHGVASSRYFLLSASSLIWWYA